MSKPLQDSPQHSSAKEEKLVRFTFDAPASLRKAFKLKVAEEEKSIKEVMLELMKTYLNNENTQKK